MGLKMMLASGTIFSCLLLLVTAEPFNGYDLGNYVGLLAYHDSPRYEYVKFPTDDSSRMIRKSHYREYEHPPGPTYYPSEYSSYHHGPSFHAPPPNHGPPRIYHRRPPPHIYGPPPPFGKPHHHGPSHNRYPFHHHHLPTSFGSGENFNFESWESQEYEDPTDDAKDCKGTSRNPRPGPSSKEPIFSTYFSARPNKNPTTIPQSNFKPTPPKTVTTTANGISISAPNDLVSGNVNQGNCHQQNTLLSSPSPPREPSNNFVTPPRPDLSNQEPDVSSLINGVFQNTGQQFGQQGNPNNPTSSGTDVDSLVAGVFPGFGAQTGQTQQPNIQTPSTTNVDSLLGGVFPSLNTQNNQPQPSNIPNPSTPDIDSLVSGVFSPTTGQTTPTSTQNIPTTSGTNVGNLIAGVFPSLSQNQQNSNPSVVTAPSTANGLVSGILQGLPQQGGRIPSSNNPPFPRPSQNNGDSIPVFQPDIPTLTNQQQNSPGSSNSNINSSQNIPVFQPPIEASSDNSGVTPTASTNGDESGSSNKDDEPAFDIDIRLGQIGEEVTPNTNQRNGTPT